MRAVRAKGILLVALVGLVQSSGSAAIQPSDVQKLAQAMANHLNAGLAG